MKELGPVDTMWEELGWSLDISDEQLEDIRTQYSCHGDALREMLRIWLPGGSHWGGIVRALRSIQKDSLCSRLKVKYGECNHRIMITSRQQMLESLAWAATSCSISNHVGIE